MPISRHAALHQVGRLASNCTNNSNADCTGHCSHVTFYSTPNAMNFVGYSRAGKLPVHCGIRNQLDITQYYIYFSFISCSTCFGLPCAHPQELTTYWYFCRMWFSAVAVQFNRPILNSETGTPLRDYTVWCSQERYVFINQKTQRIIEFIPLLVYCHSHLNSIL